jgi:hypothetical protein
MVGILVVLLASTNVQAKLQLVGNFESLVGESPDGQACTGVLGGTWDTQSEGTGNIDLVTIDGTRGVSLTGNSNGNGRAIGFNGITNTIDYSETGILFFRFMFRVSSRATRTFMGLISDTSDDPVNSTSTNDPMNTPVVFRWVDNDTGGLDVVTMDGATVLMSGLVRAQWYNIWIVANNAADTFDLFISKATGPAGEATLPNPEDLVKSSIPFVIATTDPLTGMIISNPSGTSQAERVWFDEVYWDGDQGLATPTKARNPSPANQESDVPRDVTLSWTPGPFAVTHDVYFGIVFDDVKNASRINPLGVLASQGQNATTYDLSRLEFSQSYYWRIDEVNAPPDSTIHKGDTWQFTVEHIAYSIAGENITAAATSSNAAEEGPENTINGSGLDADDLHSNAPTDMWLSSAAGPQPAWIEFQFDKVYKLHQMLVWNYNTSIEPVIGFGIKEATIEYSVDGADWTTLGTTHEFAQASGAADYAHNTTIDFAGVGAKYVRLTANSNWGGFMPQYGLSEVRFFYIPVNARNPYPDSEATGVDPDVVLGWTAGREAVTHDVYVSTDEQAVIDGTAPVATVAETSHGPLSLDLDTTYYWKVNEVNEAEAPSTWESNIWSLTTTDHIVVDDFESYNDLDPTDPNSNRIFNVWLDGYGVATNGSVVGYETPPFCEQTTVHGGKQSMPLAYSNTDGATYSEAERTFAASQDWTKAGAATLVLYFHGTEGNTGQLYVKVNDSKVVYGGDAGDIAKAEWQQWNIDLASLGIDLQNVTKLSIGVDGNSASGTLYFDDIRLYRLAPEPQAN